jgi:hypothetical protein
LCLIHAPTPSYAKIAKIVLTLVRYCPPFLRIKVHEKDGYLYLDEQRLDEHLPGLFFTEDGECLDLRGAKVTWQNQPVKKIR